MGRSRRNEKTKIVGGFTPMVHRTVDSPAWLALSVTAKALYPAIMRRCRQHGNGRATYSVRQAAADLNINKDTAQKAFYDLQAKGFIQPTSIGAIGLLGVGRASAWRVTELPWDGGMPASKEFERWSAGNDYEPLKGALPRKNQKPVLRSRTPCPIISDVDPVEAGA